MPRRSRKGRAVFAKVRLQCNTLFGVGRLVGPDLTGSKPGGTRLPASRMSSTQGALIGMKIGLPRACVIATTDGRVLTGIISPKTKTHDHAGDR